MKKTALTFVAVAFGMGVAFAQTTPQTDQQQNTGQSISVDKMSDKPAEARSMKVEELPAEVQANLKGDAFKDFTVISVAEVQSQAQTGTPAAAQYQIAMVEKSAAGATEPTLVVLFDEKGKEVSRQTPAAMKQEE
ncbi:hypothetical protein [Cesiribacter sp. SM1]|uniref:hypothetical protein n=1 Tax=Cesiribacter sp. SM1 TaxID=2861196 RepID=UPI001CD6230F|nr:hypothetical protein [Cesiribacter sp. SM1]